MLSFMTHLAVPSLFPITSLTPKLKWPNCLFGSILYRYDKVLSSVVIEGRFDIKIGEYEFDGLHQSVRLLGGH